MHQKAYRFIFADMMDQLERVRMISDDDPQEQVAHFGIDLTQLMHRAQRPIPSHVADLIDLALAVYVADRFAIRDDATLATITVSLPVRHQDVLNTSATTQHLRDVLFWFTGDQWEFEFERRAKPGRSVETQLNLQLGIPTNSAAEVSLWSGGLDSLAGLYTRLIDEPDVPHVLFGTGSNPIMHATQQRAAKAVDEVIPERTILIQAPIRADNTGMLRKSACQRSRGFVFMLLGAACAYLEGQQVLDIYENGIGAINLPFRASEVGLDHSRSVHPLSLMAMSTLVSHLLGTAFTFRNQFVLTTKAEICARLAHPRGHSLIFSTITCDRLHRIKGLQCGCCSSCLLRRQAIAVHAIHDETPYVVLSAQERTPKDRYEASLHLRAMLHQVAIFSSLFTADDPWFAFAYHYPTLGDIVDRSAIDLPAGRSLADELLELYRRYVHEWHTVQHMIGRDLLEDVDVYMAP